MTLLFVVLAVAPVKIAAAGLGGVGVDEGLLAALSEKAALEVAQAPNVSLITRQDVEALLGRERQRQLLGCADESGSCVAELAGALGAALVLAGDLAKVGARYTVTLKLLDARTGRAVFSGARDAANEDELLEVVKSLARQARLTLSPPGPKWQPVIPLALGLGLGAGGAFLLVRAQQNVGAIAALSSGSAAALSDAMRLRDDGKTFATVGTVLLVAAGVALVAAVLWWVL